MDTERVQLVTEKLVRNVERVIIGTVSYTHQTLPTN